MGNMYPARNRKYMCQFLFEAVVDALPPPVHLQLEGQSFAHEQRYRTYFSQPLLNAIFLVWEKNSNPE